MSIQRIAMGISYDGSAYHGWQAQEGLRTVQATLEKALSSVANHPVVVTCAGRTDAGVHACEQIVHFNTEAWRSEHAWVFGVNSNLPRSVNVLWARAVGQDFHARYSAMARRYRYILYNDSIRPAILSQAVSWQYRPLDEISMQLAGEYLLGQHDFTSFRGANCQARSPVRTLHRFRIERRDRLIITDIEADGFLHHMVRNIMGVLMIIGSGERPIEWIKEVLQARDRREAAMTASPNGLYLIKVQYPPEFDFPKSPPGPFFL